VSRTYSFVQLDVFTRQAFAGNPLAVFPDAVGMSDAEMQSVAREMNLSETTFVLPPTKPGADYRVRIFTPVTEVPYAGHPSIGTAWHLASAKRVLARPPSTRVHQEVKAGVLPIDIEFDGAGELALVHTTQAKPEFQAPVQDRARVAAALGLTLEDLHPGLPIQLVSTGLGWLLVPLRDADALDRVQPDRSYFEGKDAVHYDIYPFTLGPRPAGVTTEARGFPIREFEDPVTGSASGCLGAYLARHGVLEPRDGLVRFMHAQGRHLHRPGLVSIEVKVDAHGDPETVRVGGAAVEVLRGELTMP
jgi:trans-2,3-dihydro-3-hydroxyanthranilate isomerase